MFYNTTGYGGVGSQHSFLSMIFFVSDFNQEAPF